MGAVAGDKRAAVEGDRRDKDRPILVVDWQGSHIRISAMERGELDRFRQRIESANR